MAAILKTSTLISFRALLCLFAVTFVVGCSNDRQLQGDSSAGAPQPGFSGTSDSGGGNTIAGRPLESYRFNPVERPEYQKFLADLIARTEADTKVLNNRLSYVLKKKNWYLIPVSLSSLPPEKIGTSFSAEQSALQNFDEIWIDQKKFDAMTSDEERAKLLFHEIVMGLKILRFDSEFNNCLAICDAVRGTETDNLKACERYNKTGRLALELTKEDYADIRFVTDEVFSSREKISSVRFTELLKLKNFDTRLVSYSIQQDVKALTPQAILNLIAANSEAQTLPRFTGFDSRGQAKMQCDLSWDLPEIRDGARGILKLQVSFLNSNTKGIMSSKSFEFELPEGDKPYKAESGFRIGEKVLNTIELWPKSDAISLGGHVLNIDFENEQIRSIRVLKIVHVPETNSSCDGCTSLVSRYANTSMPGNEPIFCYFKENLPKDFDLFSHILDQ